MPVPGKKPTKRHVALPALSLGPKKPKLNANQRVLKIGKGKFLLENWGFKEKDSKSIHLGIQKFSGGKGKGSWLALASAYALKQKIPGIDAKKAWSLEVGVMEKGLDTENRVSKMLFNKLFEKAKKAKVKTLVVSHSIPTKEQRALLSSLGFERIGETSIFVKTLK